MTEFLIGTSGWSYDHWRGIFYPETLPTNQWLPFYAQTFSTVELNMSFYRTPFPNMVHSWLNKTPPGFVFTIKASRYITHIKRLKDIKDPIDRLYALVSTFGNKACCILFQLPPSFDRNEEHIRRLLNLLGLLHHGYDHAIEFRHPSWWSPDTYELLRGKAAFCIVNGLSMPEEFAVTCPVAYIRFHGYRYNTDYPDDALGYYAGSLSDLAQHYSLERMYVYFNNDVGGFAVRNAATMKQKLSIEQKAPSPHY